MRVIIILLLVIMAFKIGMSVEMLTHTEHIRMVRHGYTATDSLALNLLQIFTSR